MSVMGMNHAVLYVRDATKTAEFYEGLLGFRRIIDDPGGQFIFLRAPRSNNHHDLALFTIGAAGPSEAGRGTVGLYHIAWEVGTLSELAEILDRIKAAGAFVGSSDHGPNKSVYAKDPDGLEFEVMWLVPADRWGDEEHEAIIRPLNIAEEQVRFADLVAEGKA